MNVLNIQEDGLFPYKRQEIRKSHILPFKFLKKNILEHYRKRFWSSKYANIKLHRFFHHLNSSQALCINLFYPLLAENLIDLFLDYLKISYVANVAMFEKKSSIEKSGRRTSFDFYVETKNNKHVFVEVKYTENGFGKAKYDKEHQKKFQNTYLPVVKKSKFLEKKCEDEGFFFDNYQVLRNLIHINSTDYVVLLFPYENIKVRKEANSAKALLTDLGKEKLKIVYLEELSSFFCPHCIGTPLEGYYKHFNAKYFPGK